MAQTERYGVVIEMRDYPAVKQVALLPEGSDLGKAKAAFERMQANMGTIEAKSATDNHLEGRMYTLTTLMVDEDGDLATFDTPEEQLEVLEKRGAVIQRGGSPDDPEFPGIINDTFPAIMCWHDWDEQKEWKGEPFFGEFDEADTARELKACELALKCFHGEAKRLLKNLRKKGAARTIYSDRLYHYDAEAGTVRAEGIGVADADEKGIEALLMDEAGWRMAVRPRFAILDKRETDSGLDIHERIIEHPVSTAEAIRMLDAEWAHLTDDEKKASTMELAYMAVQKGFDRGLETESTAIDDDLLGFVERAGWDHLGAYDVIAARSTGE